MLIDKIKANPRLKKFAHWCLIPTNEYKPRTWVKIFLNPFKHKKGKGSRIAGRTRMDVLPFNDFRLGDYSTIEEFSTINNGVGDVIIGTQSLIGIGNVIIGPVVIGNNVMLAQNIVISGLNHGYEDVSKPPKEQRVTVKQIKISDNVWIGANSVVTSGVSIGKHSVIGAGSIVTKDIPEYVVAAGNPAKILKKYNFQTRLWERV